MPGLGQVAQGRAALEKIIPARCRCRALADDLGQGPAHEGRLVARARDGAGIDEERRRQAPCVHQRHGNAKLVLRAVVVGQGDAAILAVLPFEDPGLRKPGSGK